MKYRIHVVALLGALSLAGCAGHSAQKTDTPVAAAKSAAETARERARLRTELGMAYLASGQLSTAYGEARTAIATDAGFAPAHNLMGLVLMQMQEHERAEEHFQQALRLAPDDGEISSNMGWFLCQNGREAASFAYFEAAAKNPLYATPARPLVNAALCALRLKDYKRAQAYVNDALRRDPGDVYAQYVFADVLYRQGRFDEARTQLAEVHRQAEPTAASLWLALRIDRKLNDHEAELRWGGQLRRKFPDSPEYKSLSRGIFD